MEFEKLKKVIAEVLNVDPEEIKLETTFMDDLGADSLDLFQVDIPVTTGDELGCCIFDTVDMDGEDTDCSCRYRYLGYLDATDIKTDILLRGEVLQSFVVVDEDKTTLA